MNKPSTLSTGSATLGGITQANTTPPAVTIRIIIGEPKSLPFHSDFGDRFGFIPNLIAPVLICSIELCRLCLEIRTSYTALRYKLSRNVVVRLKVLRRFVNILGYLKVPKLT